MRTLIVTSAVLIAIAAVTPAEASLLVGDMTNNKIFAYDATTGAAEGLFIDLAGQGYTAPKHMEVGPDGNLYVQVAEGVARYNATTGAYVDQLTTTRAKAMTIGDDGTVYLGGSGADVASNEIWKVDPVTKAASLVKALTNAKWPGSGVLDHAIFSLSMADASTIVAMDDPSAWNVATGVSTDGSTAAGYYGYLENFYTNFGNDHTDTRWYYNRDDGGGKLFSLDVAQGSVLNTGTGYNQDGFLADTGNFNGAVRTGPDGLAYYVANEGTGTEIRVVTSDDGSTAIINTLLTDATLGQAFGLAWNGTVTPPPHPGDANGDGTVDLQDFGQLKDNFGLTTGAVWADGDFNADGSVDLQDFGILKDHFGHSAGDPLTAIPEPATLALLAIGGLAALRRRRGR